MGDHLKFSIGRLSYELPSNQDSTLTKPVIIGVITGACILVIIVIIILIAYRRKSTESSRVLKSMQEQMDVLELRVASECKEGESLIYNTFTFFYVTFVAFYVMNLIHLFYVTLAEIYFFYLNDIFLF